MIRAALALRGNERTILNRPASIAFSVFVHELDGFVAVKKHDGTFR